MTVDSINVAGLAVTVEERPTMRIRIKKGLPGTLIPPSFGLEQEWSCLEWAGGAPVRQWREWRPVEVVEHDAE